MPRSRRRCRRLGRSRALELARGSLRAVRARGRSRRVRARRFPGREHHLQRPHARPARGTSPRPARTARPPCRGRPAASAITPSSRSAQASPSASSAAAVCGERLLRKLRRRARDPAAARRTSPRFPSSRLQRKRQVPGQPHRLVGPARTLAEMAATDPERRQAARRAGRSTLRRRGRRARVRAARKLSWSRSSRSQSTSPLRQSGRDLLGDREEVLARAGA